MAPPADLVVAAHFNDLVGQSLDLDYVRDSGSKTGSGTGNPEIVAAGEFYNCLDLVDAAASNIVYSGANIIDTCITKFTVSLWVKPNYSGAPGVNEIIISGANSYGSFARGFTIRHTAGGSLLAAVYDDAGTAIVTLASAWSPTAGTWYHIELDSECDTGGYTRLFVDGTEVDGNNSTTARTLGPQWLAVGKNATGADTVNDFSVDELLIYDDVQHTANFSPPTTEVSVYSETTLANGSFETMDGDTVAWPTSWTPYAASYGLDIQLFGSPYLTCESYEYGFLSNQDYLAGFEASDLSVHTFDVALENYEDYEEEWSSNENWLEDWPASGVEMGFDLAGDAFEDYEEEWYSRHAQIDTRWMTAWPLPESGTPSTVHDALNELKSKFNAHLIDFAVHPTLDTTNTITSPDATDLSSSTTLADELWVDCWAHFNDSGLTWHREDFLFSMAQPTITEYPASDYADCTEIAIRLILAINPHFVWSDNAGVGHVDAFADYGTGTNIYDWAEPIDFDKSGIYENYEAGWLNNEFWDPALDPGDVDDMAFDKTGGSTEDFETYEEQIALQVLASVGNGTPDEIDPTGNVYVQMAGHSSGVGTYLIQTRSVGSSTFVTRATVDENSDDPAVDVLDEGYEEIRIRTDAYTSGSPTAFWQWNEI